MQRVIQINYHLEYWKYEEHHTIIKDIPKGTNLFSQLCRTSSGFSILQVYLNLLHLTSSLDKRTKGQQLFCVRNCCSRFKGKPSAGGPTWVGSAQEINRDKPSPANAKRMLWTATWWLSEIALTTAPGLPFLLKIGIKENLMHIGYRKWWSERKNYSWTVSFPKIARKCGTIDGYEQQAFINIYYLGGRSGLPWCRGIPKHKKCKKRYAEKPVYHHQSLKKIYTW
jgi:hypothetical protein